MVAPGGRRFALVLVAVFSLLQLGKLLRHALWRDELQAWLIVRDSPSLGHMFHLLRYEAHPALWYLLLYPLVRLHLGPLAMQLCHLLIATASIYVLARHAPLSRRDKVLLSFGYFLFFEYATISRNYALEVLVLFLLCATYRGAQRGLVFTAALIFVLVQTQAYGTIVGLALCGALCLDLLLCLCPVPREEVLGALALLLVAAVLLVLQIDPPLDLGYDGAGAKGYNPQVLTEVGGSLFSGLLPVPWPTLEFWNSNILDPCPLVKLSLGVLLLVLVPLFHVRWPALCLLLLSGYGGLLALGYFKVIGYERHWGHAFLLLICATWMSRSGDCHRWQPVSPVLCRVVDRLDLLRPRLFTGLLIVHACAGLWASAIDVAVPFSASGEVARYLKEQHLDGGFLIADTDFTTVPISGLLGRKLYYPSRHQMGSYVIWDKTRHNPDQRSLCAEALRLVDRRDEEALAVLSYPLKQVPPRFTLVRSFENSTNPTERYYLYRVSRKDPRD